MTMTYSIGAPAHSYDDDVLYFNLYPGSVDKLEHTVALVVAPVVESLRGVFDRWFFIRYSDIRGAHIRLRLIGDRRALSAQYDTVCHQLRERLAAVIALPDPEPEERLVRTPRTERPKRGAAGVSPSVYEPEWSKYGSFAALRHCEQLFEQSSELALRSTSASLRTKVTIATLLMQATTRAGLISEPEQVFWLDYARYWTGQQGPFADRVRAQLSEVAPRLSAQLANSQLSEPLRALTLQHFDCIRSTVGELRQLEPGLSAEHYCFHLTHMTNNRLGIPTIEEALLAFVVAAGLHDFSTQNGGARGDRP
jgi:thiopeptide-type bacteriocin biosynthesis protein